MRNLMRSLVIAGLFVLFSSRAYAFDIIDRETGFIASKYLTLGVGVGFTGFSRQQGIEGDTGFGLKVTGGHQFNRYLSGEIYYQFSTFNLDSPDPVNPAQKINTGAQMNQTGFNLMLFYPAVLAQPYISVGIGGYNWMGVDPSTALDVPMNFMFPIAAGVRAFIYRNRISLDTEFNYQVLFGENQEPDTLKLLGLSKVSFDSYSFITSVTFHFF